jgi:hypothetical protein
MEFALIHLKQSDGSPAIRKGDIILNVEAIESEWFAGRIRTDCYSVFIIDAALENTNDLKISALRSWRICHWIF